VPGNVTAENLLEAAQDALDEGDAERALDLAIEGSRLAGRADDEELTARLALAEGQALLALGDSRAALARIALAVRAFPDDLDVRAEEASALHENCRFEEAADLLTRILHEDPGDAGCHWLLGLCLERLGRAEGSERHLRRARELAPADFPEPVSLSPDAFEAVVEAALAELPEPVRRYLANVAVTVEDLPEVEELLLSDPPHSPSILGIFRGSPLGDKASMDPWSHFPSSIALFQRNLERYAGDREELLEEIRVTLLHEVGHFLGLDEDQLRDLGLD
jgi:predicted Zn-dependent protease with MMP-like domain/Flp pilus assembly protein TadD